MKKKEKNQVREYYERHVSEEDRRLDENVFEIPLTMKYIERYLQPGSKILDIACGTGRYAGLLLEKGYRLGLNDLSGKNMILTRKRVGDHPNLMHTSISDALEADIWEREEWDGILVLGPLYHLTQRKNRLKVLAKAGKAVREGGYVFSAFMSRTGAMLYGLKNNPQGIARKGGAKKLWKTGTDDAFVEATEWSFFTGWINGLRICGWISSVNIAKTFT